MRKLLLSLLLSFALCQPSLAMIGGEYVDDMWIDQGERIISLNLQADKPFEHIGWTRRGRGEVFRVRVKAGDKFRLELSSKSEFLLMAVFDFADPDAEAIFFSEPDNRKTTLTIKRDTELLIRPIYILGQSRRGLGIRYELILERKTS